MLGYLVICKKTTHKKKHTFCSSSCFSFEVLLPAKYNRWLSGWVDVDAWAQLICCVVSFGFQGIDEFVWPFFGLEDIYFFGPIVISKRASKGECTYKRSQYIHIIDVLQLMWDTFSHGLIITDWYWNSQDVVWQAKTKQSKVHQKLNAWLVLACLTRDERTVSGFGCVSSHFLRHGPKLLARLASV